MLEQRPEDLQIKKFSEKEIISRMSEKGRIIYDEEMKIDPKEKLYLITFSPKVDDLPESDFHLQHEFNIEMLAEYLKYCKCGAWCVEASQMANPHYHGWYQIDEEMERYRIVMMKVLQRFAPAGVRLKECLYYKINTWHDTKNGLFYYKKDLVRSMLWILNNPITKDTKTYIDWNALEYRVYFTKEMSPKAAKLVTDKVSFRREMKEFYNK